MRQGQNHATTETSGSPDWPLLNEHREGLHMIVLYYTTNVTGIPICLGWRVTSYFEEANGAGVVLERGEKVSGDVVTGCDGVHSEARELVLWQFGKPRSSQDGVLRVWHTTEKILDDPGEWRQR